MILYRIGWAACWLALLAAAASAVTVPDHVVVTSSHDWIVANGVDASTITATVYNQSTVVNDQQLTIMFNCAEPTLGMMSSTSSTIAAGTSATATSVFRAAKKSGDIPIDVIVQFTDAEGVYHEIAGTFIQKVDHDTPYRISYRFYTSEVTVGETTPIILKLTDQWDNPVDDRRIAEEVRFADSTSDRAGFWSNATSSWVDEIRIRVNATGYASTLYKVDTTPKENVIWVQPPNNIDEEYIYINSVANAPPFSIVQELTPYVGNPPYLPADGISKYYITYTLIDRYGNPSSGRSMWVNTTIPGESKFVTSNSEGKVVVTYGPKYSLLVVAITATSADNASVTCSQAVKFVSTSPTNMLLTASPQSMPSLDVNGTTTSDVMAKVIDEIGNPVANQTVDFQIIHPAVYPASQSQPPTLSATTALTDSDGYAIVKFSPGMFVTSGPNYNYQASANCTIQATWSSNQSFILLEWKNYPYLSVETAVDKAIVEVNETIDVTVRLKGDGWALQPAPIDVVLCTDRSGSMLKDDPDRMISVVDASKDFVAAMDVSPARDHIGLVSFGTQGWANLTPRPYLRYDGALRWDWNPVYSYWYWVGNDGTYDCQYSSTYYSTSSIHHQYVGAHYPGNNRRYLDYAIAEQALSSSTATINASITQMVPAGGTPMRYGIYKAIGDMIANGRTSVVRAIIVLSDGDYNYYGDPLARGTGSTSDPTGFGDLTENYKIFSGISSQNMSEYARNNNIKIYAIGYAEDLTVGGKDTLRILAETTGGKYYDGSAGNIADVYRSIAGELKTEAGANTTMDLVFENVKVNNITVPGADVFEYQHVLDESTFITSWNGTVNPIPADPPYPRTLDQTADWNDNHNLHFDVGTISLGQIWEATFRLKVKTEGNINIFGTGSSISFNNGTASLALPDTYISVRADHNSTGLESQLLDISNLTCTSNGPIIDLLPLEWNLTYLGTQTVTESVYYSNDDGLKWIRYSTNKTNAPAGFMGIHGITLDVRDFPAGDYLIQVRAEAPDAPSDREDLVTPIQIGLDRIYIKIE